MCRSSEKPHNLNVELTEIILDLNGKLGPLSQFQILNMQLAYGTAVVARNLLITFGFSSLICR